MNAANPDSRSYTGVSSLRHIGTLSLATLLLTGCGGNQENSATEAGPVESKTASAEDTAPKSFNFTPTKRDPGRGSNQSDFATPRFEEVANELGIFHTYNTGPSANALMVETTGAGLAWVDFDLDRRPDLYLPSGGPSDATSTDQFELARLYRQIENQKFVDIVSSAGITVRHYAQGVATGDFDSDGFPDLYLTSVGHNVLLMNLGDGTFENVTDSAGVDTVGWSSSAAWGDVDLDGDLDLYVCNYAEYDPLNPVECLDKDGNPAHCHPRNVPPQADTFFLNLGDGTFKECARDRGLYGEGNRALGVAILDLTNDGWPDIYIANDTTANFFFINDGKGAFENSAIALGGAYSATGSAQASMGVAVGDYDADGYADLCLTHFTGEHNTLYRNLEGHGLQDVSAITGLRDPTLSKLGFGIIMRDFTLNSQTDLLIANGHIDPNNADGDGFEMRPQVFTFDGQKWLNGSYDAGGFFARPQLGRGIGTADFDGDGDEDVAIVHQNTAVAILKNVGAVGSSLHVTMIGTKSNRDAVGSKATIKFGDSQRTGFVVGGSSFASSSEPGITFGLDKYEGPIECRVLWPDQSEVTITVPAGTRRMKIIEGGRTVFEPESGAAL